MILFPRKFFELFLQLSSATVDQDGNHVELLAFLLGTQSDTCEIITDIVLPTQSASSCHVEDNGKLLNAISQSTIVAQRNFFISISFLKFVPSR